MMNWNLYWFYLTTGFALSLTPGPAVMLVISSALRNGPAKAIASVGGILGANALYFAISATSLGALMLSSYELFFLIKWAGAAYLVFVGAKAILTASHTRFTGAATQQKSPGQLFRDGLVLQISNPKALLFFGAILPQFLDVQLPVTRQIAVLGVTGIVAEFAVLACYAMIAGRLSALLRKPAYETLTNRLSGALLISAGGGLALMRRG